MVNIENFYGSMPEEAVQDISRMGVESISLGNGVSRIEMAGHDKGVAYRFFIHPVYNPTKSDDVGYEVFDDIEMIEWLVDRKLKPTEQIRHLPPELLKWNRQGELVGGRYKEGYDSWKTGKEAVGTPLRRWGLLTDGQVASLEAEGIYTIEQYAELDRSKIASRYPDEFLEAHDRAEKWLNARAHNEEKSEMTDRLKKAEAENAAMAERLAALEAKLLERSEEPAPKKQVVAPKKKLNLED